MPVFAAENLAGQLPVDPNDPPPDPNPSIDLPDTLTETRPDVPANRSMPMPRWTQPYIRSTGTKQPSEWGQPDYILQGARGYPGLAPSPWMPQAADSGGLMRNLGMFFAARGAIPNQLLAGQALAFYDKYERDKAAGLLARANLNLKEAQLRQIRLSEATETELRALSETHAAYSNDPQKLAAQWVDLSYQFNNPVLRDVIQTQGLKRAEEYVNELHNNNLDSLKLIHQRLENQKVQLENERAEETQQRIRELYQAPSQRQRQTEALDSPVQGINAQTGLPNPQPASAPLMNTDPSVAPGSQSAPTYSWFPKDAQAPQAQQPPAEQPTAPGGGWPAGITLQNAPNRRGELIDYANRNGVALPPPDTAGLTQWVLAHQPGTPAAAGTPQQGIGAPAASTLGQLAGYDQATLDRLAWRYLERNELPHTRAGGKDFADIFTLQNLAVQNRSYVLDAWLDNLLKTLPPSAANARETVQGQREAIAKGRQVLAQIDKVEPSLSARLRAILQGDIAMPAGGFGGNSPYGQKVAGIITRLDPTYSTIRFENNRNANRYWTVGQGAAKLSGFKQAMYHARTLLDIVDRMPNTQFRDLNALINNIQTRAGLPYTTEFDSVFGHFTQELTRAFRGSAGALGDINREHAILNSNASPLQMKEYIRVMSELLTGAVDNMADDWNRATLGQRRGTDLLQDPRLIADIAKIKQIPLSPSGQARVGSLSQTVYDHNKPDQPVDPQDAAMVTWFKANQNNRRDPRVGQLEILLNAKGLL